LGLANYFRKFIKDYAMVAAPLEKKTGTTTKRKNCSISWEEDCGVAFRVALHG
jgi:hypothetical protein